MAARAEAHLADSRWQLMPSAFERRQKGKPCRQCAGAPGYRNADVA
ncbi:MAG TPA: hypothetical protein VFG50_09820 [Rhodothermales bacterium]|nr:hypothetical protein [Rhodothermales bacterium]